jgi:WD40 repeat protein
MPVRMPIVWLALWLQAAAPPAGGRDPLEVAGELMRQERMRSNESAAVGDIRSAIIAAAASSPVPPRVETRGGYRFHFRAGVYTAVPVTPGATGVHGFCGDDGGRVCYTAEGAEPAVSAGRCAASCRDLPKGGPRSLLPPRLSAADRAALAGALDREGGLPLDAGAKEVVRALLADAAPAGPAPGRAHADPVAGLAFTPDGSRLVTAPMGSAPPALWSTATGQPLATLRGCERAHDVLATPDGKVVAVCQGAVALWSVADGRAGATLGKLDGGLVDLSLDKAGKTLAAVNGARATLWQLPGGQPLAAFDLAAGGGVLTSRGAVGPDGATLVTGGTGLPLEVWALPKGTRAATLDKEAADLTALAISGDGRTLAAGDATGTVAFWSLPGRRLLLRRKEHGFGVNAVAFSADGRSLLSAGSDNAVKVWSLPDGAVRHTFRGHAGEVFAVAVSPAGLVASGDRTGVVLLWDLDTGVARGALVDPKLR